MSSGTSGAVADEDTERRFEPARLFVAWQDPDSRAMEPVGFLRRFERDAQPNYEFRYLSRVSHLATFRPFVGFPDLYRAYQSAELFPLFENRVIPRTRSDYGHFVRALGLGLDADPYEVLARSEGRRQTDTLEIFPEPALDNETVDCRFLVHGVRHFPGAQDAIDELAIGDFLRVMFDCQNPVDPRAVVLRDDGLRLLGWIPRYLTDFVRTPISDIGSKAVVVRVEHIAERDGPSHLRLLCRLTADWPTDRPWPFAEAEFAPMANGAS